MIIQKRINELKKELIQGYKDIQSDRGWLHSKIECTITYFVNGEYVKRDNKTGLQKNVLEKINKEKQELKLIKKEIYYLKKRLTIIK